MKRLIALFAALGCFTAAAAEPQALYQQHCAACHGADRLGGSGPALLPESLERLKKPEALKTLSAGRMAAGSVSRRLGWQINFPVATSLSARNSSGKP